MTFKTGYLRAAYMVTALFLICAGLGWLLGPSNFRNGVSGYVVIARYVPMRVWGVLFIAAGGIKMYALLRKDRWWFRFGSFIGGTMSLFHAGGLLFAAREALQAHRSIGWGAIPAWICIATLQLMSTAASWEK